MSALVAALALALAGCNTGSGGAVMASGQNLEAIIRTYGFSRMVPASTLYPPGTLVALRDYDPGDTSRRSVQLTYLCSLAYSVALYPASPVVSGGDGLNLSSNIGAQVNLDVPALREILNLTATAAIAQSVRATLVDVKFYAYAPDDLQNIRKTLGPDCRGFVNANIATRNAYQVEQVLEATIDLQVTFKADATADAKAKALAEIAKVGVVAGTGSDISIRGKSLYYGVSLKPVERSL